MSSFRAAVLSIAEAEDHSADDKIVVDPTTAGVLRKALLENMEMKRKINLLEAKLKIEQAKHQRWTAGRTR